EKKAKKITNTITQILHGKRPFHVRRKILCVSVKTMQNMRKKWKEKHHKKKYSSSRTRRQRLLRMKKYCLFMRTRRTNSITKVNSQSLSKKKVATFHVNSHTTTFSDIRLQTTSQHATCSTVI